MPIFGQVWLWSLAAFLLGTVLCWLVVVVPVRRRIDVLERRLASARAEPGLGVPERAARGGEPPAGGVSSQRDVASGFGGRPDAESPDEIRANTLTRAYTLPGAREVPGGSYGGGLDEANERGALSLRPGFGRAEETGAPPGADPTQYVDAAGQAPSGERDWFDPDPEPGDGAAEPKRRPLDEDEDRGTIFTQRTRPIARELIREADEGGAHALVETPDAVDEAGSPVESALAAPAAEPLAVPPAEPAAEPGEREQLPRRERHRPVAAALDPAAGGNGATPLRRDRPTRHDRTAGQEDSTATHVSRPLAAEPTSRVRAEPAITLEPEPTQSALPKRIPAKPQHRHPFGVATVTPATITSAMATDDGEQLRSLFEPIVPAEGGPNSTPPPPYRMQAAASAAATSARPSAPGPFGPGSAMPLPGGASPSPEFTVKASVTALRYCMPDSPQFGRTVAEVWFRTAADAERVGFRPVG